MIDAKKKVCIVTRYKHPDYIRAVTIRHALGELDGVDTIVIKNRFTGILRYPEVIWKLIVAKLVNKPDIFLVTFRGYEILPFALLISGKKPVIFDEFINAVEWLKENNIMKIGEFLGKLLKPFYRWLLKRCAIILADTDSHAQYSAELMSIPIVKYSAVPVGTDETLFHPLDRKKNDRFTVLYYGNMLPLHGIQYVLDTAVALKEEEIEFLIIGGKEKVKAAVEDSIKSGAKITYKSWVKFDTLPGLISSSDLFLAGPFGNTLQSQHVITGKTFQSLAVGVPVVVGKVLEETEFRDKDNCLLVEQGSADDLEDAILWAYKNQKNIKTIGNAGRALYEKLFSTKIIMSKLHNVLEAIN